MLRIRSLHSPDVSIRTFVPDNPVDVYIFVEFEIGEVGAQGRDIFSVVVATPEALRRRSENNKFLLASHGVMVVSYFSFDELRASLEGIVASCWKGDWQRSVENLRRYFMWEYDGFGGVD